MTTTAIGNGLELISFERRDQWLAARTHGIGASESAALFGLSRWDSPLSLWTRKRGIVVEEDKDESESEWLEIGLAIEPTVAALYERRTQRQLWTPETPWTVARHARIPFMTASIDRWVIEAADKDGSGVLELKNVGGFMAHDWEDEPPLHYQVQVQHQLAVTGFRWASVAGLIGGNRFKHYDVERNEEFIGELEAKCIEFWEKVQRGEMPPPDGSKHTARALKALHPKDNGAGVSLPDEAVAWWDELCAIRKQNSANEKREKELKNLLAALVGPATFGSLPDGRLVSYKHCSRAGYVVDPTEFRVFREEKKATDAAVAAPRKRTKGAKAA